MKKGNKMTYDRKAEAIYIYINKAKIDKTVVLNDNVNIDLDSAGNMVGMEILGVSNDTAKKYKNKLSLMGNPAPTLI